MEEVLQPKLTKSKERAFSLELDSILAKLDENVRAMKTINKENDRLRRLTDKSHQQLTKTMESLGY